jgi:transglutaminase/protease-like cytokinesis protein 3
MKSFQEYLKDNNTVSEVTGMNVGKSAYGTANFSNSEADQLTHMMRVVDMAIAENPSRFMNALRAISSNNPEMELLIQNINLPKLKMAAKKHVEESEASKDDDSMSDDDSNYLPKGM